MPVIKLRKRLPNLSPKEEQIVTEMLCEMYASGFENGKPKWIPVTERLPEEHTTVLVCGEDGVEPGRFYGKSGFWTYDQYEQDPIFAVTHWMPLPEPPKGE